VYDAMLGSVHELRRSRCPHPPGGAELRKVVTSIKFRLTQISLVEIYC